jgi:F-type H+-transporting ATPase subunit b
VLIDWFTVGAQAVNFLILVWLLRRFLYRPVMAAIDAREKRGSEKIVAASAQEAKAQVAAEELRKRSEALDRDREGIMRRAAEEGAAEHQRLFESARQDSQALRSKLTQTLATERTELGRQLSMRAQAEVFAVAHKALFDLAGASLEDRMIEVFIARLRGLSDQQRLEVAGVNVSTALPGAIASAIPARSALVRSAFAPSPAARAHIEDAIRERLGANVAVRYETAPELICGVELTVDGLKLAWSVADYLSSLARDVAALAATDLAPPPVAPQTPLPKEAVHAP